MRWVVENISEKGIVAERVSDSGPIRKGIVNFAAKFWWTIVRHNMYPTIANNHLTLDRMVIVECLMAIYEIELIRIIIFEIHERAFPKTTTILFPFLIF